MATGVTAFGRTYTWADRTTVWVSPPESFTPDDTAAGRVAGWTCVMVSITVTNRTGATWD
jgi:hypothetical protein